MTPSPTSIVQRLYELFGAGRIDDTYALMSDGVVLHEPGDPASIPWAGEFRGHAGLKRFYDGLASGLTSIEIDEGSLKFLEVEGNRVLVLGYERGVSARTGRTYTTSSAWLWEVHGGQITGLVAFHDTAAMLAAMTPSVGSA